MAKALTDMTDDELNARALELLEDRPRREWRALQAERTRRARLAELKASQLGKAAAGLSDEEWDALRQQAVVDGTAADTTLHAAGVK